MPYYPPVSGGNRSLRRIVVLECATATAKDGNILGV